MKLFTIGDSISQGFMSAAAARTDLCYSTLIARCLGLQPGRDYLFPRWELGGHPANVELLLRRLQKLYGGDIFGPIEWPMAITTAMLFLDKVEDHFERGEGAIDKHHPTWTPGLRVRQDPWFHNVASRGMTVADAFKLTPAVARSRMNKPLVDNVFGITQFSFDRTAHAVLNPSGDDAFRDHSPIGWLRRHARDRSVGGVENLVLWLGANNALATLLEMEIRSTEGCDDVDQRFLRYADFNLWTAAHFEEEYRILIDHVVDAMRANVYPDWHVFVGDVPAVTVAPLARGVGERIEAPDPFGVLIPGGGPGTPRTASYWQYYTYVVFKNIDEPDPSLSLDFEEVYRIDKTIAQYNQIIRTVLQEANTRLGQDRFVAVETNKTLLEMAFRRNNRRPASLPGPLEQLVPKPDTRYYHTTRKGHQIEGGLFSLDGVHPSAIGQGIIAHVFIEAMKAAGVAVPHSLDWDAIIASDTLRAQPIRLMHELYDNSRLAHLVLSCIRQ